MEQEVIIKKALNNNVIIAEHEIYGEVILIGKGIGFNRTKGDLVSFNKADKTFLLKDEKEKEQYVNLLSQIDKDFVEFMNEIMLYIEESMGQSLNEHIHVALTDHLTFAVKRANQQLQFANPFLYEIETLYPKEFQIAREVVAKVEKKFAVQFPAGEISFVALHIHSAVTNKSVTDINQHHKLIKTLINVVEENLHTQLDHDRVNYNRFIQHLHRAIERAHYGEKLGDEQTLKEMLKMTYPVCYNLSWKLIKVMQKELNRPVDESEALYLTIHLQRLTNKL
ncbi:glucose PTS transporter transcription antiterminator GlcT [Aquibacillus sediminis]|uniref:glucose PTS transporter transcription antiterminator GlcT n=1 Tax=Aquibacillus sediminis TaxID=2574734 RepID=UPI0011089ECF|nr:PRD domain-containing protein [Aquibacillus sediminis]